MLGRTKVRRFAIAALDDAASPYGPDCECVGPIWETCDGDPIDILDSPSGYIGERVETLASKKTNLPIIAVYVEDRGGEFVDDNGFPKRKQNLTLLVEIYVTGDRERYAEDMCDAIEERVLYRLFRRDPVVVEGETYVPIVRMKPVSIITSTQREKMDHITFVRQIQIALDEVCDTFEQPECKPGQPVCADVTFVTSPEPSCS